MAAIWFMQLSWYLYVHSVDDNTLTSIFDQFRFSVVFLELPKVGPNLCTRLLLVASILILGYDATASSNQRAHACSGLPEKWSWSWSSMYDLKETIDYGVLGCSCISWTICKQSAPTSRQITTPTPHPPHHSISTDWMLFLMTNQQRQSTEGTMHDNEMELWTIIFQVYWGALTH